MYFQFLFFFFAFAFVPLSEVVKSYRRLLVYCFRAADVTIFRLDDCKITFLSVRSFARVVVAYPCTAPHTIVITVAVNFVSVTHTKRSFLRMRIVAYGLFFESCKGRIFIFQGSPLPAMLLFVVVIAVSVCCTLIVQPS